MILWFSPPSSSHLPSVGHQLHGQHFPGCSSDRIPVGIRLPLPKTGRWGGIRVTQSGSRCFPEVGQGDPQLYPALVCSCCGGSSADPSGDAAGSSCGESLATSSRSALEAQFHGLCFAFHYFSPLKTFITWAHKFIFPWFCIYQHDLHRSTCSPFF